VFCSFAKKAIHPFLDGSFFSASCKYKALNLSPKWKASSFLNYAGLEGNFLLLWHGGRRFLHYKVGNCAKSENLCNDHLSMNFEFKMLQEYILMYIVTILEVRGTGCHSSLWFFFEDFWNSPANSQISLRNWENNTQNSAAAFLRLPRVFCWLQDSSHDVRWVWKSFS
jgi:hypothetical protein